MFLIFFPFAWCSLPKKTKYILFPRNFSVYFPKKLARMCFFFLSKSHAVKVKTKSLIYCPISCLYVKLLSLCFPVWIPIYLICFHVHLLLWALTFSVLFIPLASRPTFNKVLVHFILHLVLLPDFFFCY